ncbi:MAG: hypothetical protein WB609_04970 [Candidatus Cybelea sp.]
MIDLVTSTPRAKADGLGLRRRPGRGVWLVEYGLILVLAVVAAAFGARVAGMGLSTLFAVVANTL